jgi:hypothetical protein
MKYQKNFASYLLLIFALTVSPNVLSSKSKPDQPSGVIFGSFNLCCQSAYWADYHLRIKRVGDKKSIVLSTAHGNMESDYTFVHELPAGKYYFYEFSSGTVSYQNSVFSEDKSFEVIEGKAVYLGHWHFDLLREKTSFSVRYDEDEVNAFFEKNKQYAISNLQIGVHGKPNFSPAHPNKQEKSSSELK